MKLSTILFLVLLCAAVTARAGEKPSGKSLLLTPKSDVFMQGFYWESPPGHIWWDSLASLAPGLASAGFSAIWFPPPEKCATGDSSMGYDPYDQFDLGEFDQKGAIPTRFGTRDGLQNAIQAYHSVGVNVYADAVMNQMNGGDINVHYECIPSGWNRPDSDLLVFNYPNGSGRFPKTAHSFYPNSENCDVSPPYHGADNPAFQFGIWLDKDQQAVRDSLVAWGLWLKNTIGFDGFRIDAVKNIDPAFIGDWLNRANAGGYAVAEDFDGTGNIQAYQQQVGANHGNTSMFDFPLRFTLRDMCNATDGSFDMTSLDGAGLVNAGMSGYNVATFVENHDLDRIGWDGKVDGPGHAPIVTDKIMAYAYTMFSEGRPCVFFKDYYMYGLKGQIDTLIWIRQHFLSGGTTKRGGLNPYYIGQNNYSTDQGVLSRDIYVARRDGYNGGPACYIVINDNPTHYVDVWVSTGLPNTTFKDYTGHDVNKTSAGDGRLDLYAPPRSYTIYVPDAGQQINHPPAIEHVTPQIVYTNTPFSCQTSANDADNNPLSYSLVNTPSWLTVSSAGLLSGTPVFGDVGTSSVIINVEDTHGAVASDTFSMEVKLNRPPVVSAVHDTTIRIAVRYESQITASDPDGDTLAFGFLQSPGWLNIGSASGILSGTPAIEDTGSFLVKFDAADGKGGIDTAQFTLTVSSAHDTVIATYGKPKIDGRIHVDSADWSGAWQLYQDSTNDSRWWHHDTLDNELYGVYATWDADSLYLGVDYFTDDVNNTLMLYIDAGLPGGQTNFNALQGYNGAHQKNFRFRSGDGVDFFFASYLYQAPILYKLNAGSTTIMTGKYHAVRGDSGRGAEMAIAWNDLYGLGAGLVPPHVQLKIVALEAGGYNWGAGDAAPDQPDVNGYAGTPPGSGPDSIIHLLTILPDSNADGIPDPTVYIDSIVTPPPPPPTTREIQAPVLKGWNMVSVPLFMTDYHANVLFSAATTDAFYFDAQGYHTQSILELNTGYWLKFGAAGNVTFKGGIRTRDTITVQEGWNLVGVLADTIQVPSVVQQPASIIVSNFFYYNAGYLAASELLPGKGYWIKTNQAGRLILSK